jgi:TPR repeat protein
MTNGMLPAAAGGRPSFIRHMIGLYRGDAAFRGVVDFTAIGVIVLLFLGNLNFLIPNWQQPSQPPTPKVAETKPAETKPADTKPADTKPADTRTADTKTADTKPVETKQAETKPAISPSTTQSKTQPSPSPAPAPTPAIVAFNFPDAVSNPKLSSSRIFDLDEAVFRTSAAVDQPRLAAAARAIRTQQFAAVPDLLAAANAADPNVAFMRGIAAITAGSEEGNKSAEQFWRAAADAGHRQAALELARIRIYAPPGVAKDRDRGFRTIEGAAAAGDRRALRLAGIAYLSGEFGLDPAKARDYLGRAAQAGDLEAMLHYAFVLGWAIGGPADQAQAEEFVRRAAINGLTGAQETLGVFLLQRFNKKLIDDPAEGIDLLQKAVDSGYSLRALRALALFYGVQKEPPWNDKSRIFQLARLCSGIADGWCQAESGWVFQYGIGTARDLAKAFAHYQVAADLGYASAKKSLDAMGPQVSAADKAAAGEFAQKLRVGLKPVPEIWEVQYPGLPPPAWRWVAVDESPAPKPVVVPTPTPAPALAPVPSVQPAPTVTPLPVMPLR